MTVELEDLYENAVRQAEGYLQENEGEVDVPALIRVFMTALLDSGYGVAPLEATPEMLDATDPAIADYHRTLYRRMIMRRPRLSI